ncbi:hypothetical protein COT52_01500 [candidate division WWE3 bacterium CG08_land_8_20_14_0_20_43_13]|uniref:Mannosyl-glycoprotein endo-beta-N-acetylglucosamidase-like domain-containing protein n=1 Tax=candidate division WWE3 bacterium CG08_land_8_20_14_0_20_43_13 TaxID=1975087 RepID=A0A2H0X7H2_UNCKA|nr:MAG: hypothetical protein COT52_01500 [candidate division WWE3 bacterium CG08_land_8_20_14_0_20_43_13]
MIKTKLFSRNIKRIIVIASPLTFFAGVNLLVIILCGLLAVNNDQNFRRSTKKYSSSFYSSQPKVLGATAQNLSSADARGAVIEQFLAYHQSPMAPYGRYLVTMADKYNIPWNLMPAIAMQESNAGKKIPAGSFNPFGWAIFGDQVKGFGSWEESIETVAKGLRKNYFDQGLTTPEAIMPKYCPPSLGKGGPWAKGVRFFMEEMQT